MFRKKKNFIRVALEHEKSVFDNNNKENHACYPSLFNYSTESIKLLPSQASGLNVISRNFHIQQSQLQQHQLHSQDLLDLHFSPMHQQLPIIFYFFLHIWGSGTKNINIILTATLIQCIVSRSNNCSSTNIRSNI